jgi:hypothetical protein
MSIKVLLVGGHGNGRVTQLTSATERLEIPVIDNQALENTVPVAKEAYRKERVIVRGTEEFALYLADSISESECWAQLIVKLENVALNAAFDEKLRALQDSIVNGGIDFNVALA